MTTEMAIDLATLEQIPVVVITRTTTGVYEFEADCKACLDVGMEVRNTDGDPVARPRPCLMCRPLSRVLTTARLPR